MELALVAKAALALPVLLDSGARADSGGADGCSLDCAFLATPMHVAASPEARSV